MKVRIAVSLLVSTALSFSVQAAEYSVTPYVKATVNADTNKRLTTQDSKTTTGTTLEAGAVFTAANEKTSASITPRFLIGRFSDDGNDVEQDQDDYFLDANASHRFNDRLSIGGTFGYANAGVVGTELDELGLVLNGDDTFATEVDQITENFSRETISFGPSLTYILNETNSLTFGANYSETEYDTNKTGLANYDYTSLNASWIRQLNETDQISISIFVAKQDPELDFLVLNSAGGTGISAIAAAAPDPRTLDSGSDETGISLGYVRGFSDTLIGRFNIGTRKTDAEFADLVDFDINLSAESAALIGTNVVNRLNPILSNVAFLQANPTFFRNSRTVNRVYNQGKSNGNGLTLDASLEKSYEKATVTAGLSRGTQPSGRGITEVEEYYVRGNYLWSDRITAKGSLRYFTIESFSEETLNRDSGTSDQIRLELAVDWRWTEFWTVGAGYTYREISREGADTADGHGVFFTLGYNGRRYSRSR